MTNKDDLRKSKNFWRRMARKDKEKGNLRGRKMSVELALWYRDRIRKLEK